MSDDNIRKGQLWRTEIGNRLGDTNFGVVFVSAENQHEPWLNFESGALAKHVEESSVAPILLDLADSELDGPLKHFQTTKPNRNDILKLVQSINNAASDSERRDLAQVQQVFDRFWDDLEVVLTYTSEALKAEPANVAEPERPPAEVMNELLILSRGQSRMIANLVSASTPVMIGSLAVKMADVNLRAGREVFNILGSEKLHGSLSEFPRYTIWLKEGSSADAEEQRKLQSSLTFLGFTDIQVRSGPDGEAVELTSDSSSPPY